MRDHAVEDVVNAREAHNAAIKAFDEAKAAHDAWEAAGHSEDDASSEDEDDAVVEEPAVPADPGDYIPLCSLAWWRTNSDKYPTLAWMARSFLSICVSSAEVERLFSKGALVITPHRNRLGDHKSELYIMAAYNMTAAWKAEQKLGGKGGYAASDVLLTHLFPEVEVDSGETDEEGKPRMVPGLEFEDDA